MMKPDDQPPFTVSAYLGILNDGLQHFRATVSGEVSSIDIRGNYLFFRLKDKHDESVLSCFMWKRSYDACNLQLREGMEIAALGVPEIYKPRGTFTFQAARVTEIGEGALKRAYDELKVKLGAEGLFAEEKKRELPRLPKKIGLVTSKTGAVINDFLTNIGKWGFEIEFCDSRVEGLYAERDLLAALRHFRAVSVDVLVVIRGGGSMESLAAFNSEALVRAIADFPAPVIAGIGHDKDVPLAALAADRAVSTPTAAAEALNRIFETEILRLESMRSLLSERSAQFFGSFRLRIARAADRLSLSAEAIMARGKMQEARLSAAVRRFAQSLQQSQLSLSRIESGIEAQSPLRALRLGYGIIRAKGGRLVRSAKDARKGEAIALQVSDGTIEATVTDSILR